MGWVLTWVGVGLLLGSCDRLGLGVRLDGFRLFFFGHVGGVEDALGLGDDAGEHTGLLAERLCGLVHQDAEVIALGDEDGLLGGGLDAGSAQAQALVQNHGLVQLSVGVGLVDDVALEVLREVALRTDAAVRLRAVEHHDLEVGGETLTLTEVGEHHGEDGHHDVLGLGGFHTLNCEEFGGRGKLALDTHLALVQEHGCIGGNGVNTEDAVGNVELDVVVGGVFLCHNFFDLRPFAPLLFALPHRLPYVRDF